MESQHPKNIMQILQGFGDAVLVKVASVCMARRPYHGDCATVPPPPPGAVSPTTVPSPQEHTHTGATHSHPTLFTLEVLEAIWRRDPTSQRPDQEDHTHPIPLPNPFNTLLWRV